MAKAGMTSQGLDLVEQYYQDYGCRIRELKKQGKK